jgi:hypothetical protein
MTRLLRRRSFVGAVAGMTGLLTLPRRLAAASVSHLWDNGGSNPFDPSIKDVSVTWCIQNFPGLSDSDRAYFLNEWAKWGKRGFDSRYNPTVVVIRDGDQWLQQYFGGGELLQNIVAQPSTWRLGLSRLAIVLTLDNGGHFKQILIPQVCGNVSWRIIISPQQPDCIPREALGNPIPVSSLWR